MIATIALFLSSSHETLAQRSAAGQAADQQQDRSWTVTSFDGVPIAYEVHGEGMPVLVFVHGWSCDRRYWESQVEFFSQRFQVVSLDLAGHGDSGLERDIWTISSFGLDVAAVVEELTLERVVLIGHSLGGDAILEAARRLPGRVAGLVWVDDYGTLGAPRSLEEAAEIVVRFDGDFATAVRDFVRGTFPSRAEDALVEWVAEDMSAAPPEIARAMLKASMTYDREAPVALRELGLPIVAINPDTPATDSQALERHGVEVLLMPGVGHFPMLEDPATFNDLLMRAVESFPR